MFAAKSTLFLALFAASAQLAVAIPPACLLAAVNTESEPSNVALLCGRDSSKVKAQIKSKCHGGNVDEAMTAYENTCKGYSGSSASSSSSPSSTGASASASVTGSVSSTGAPYPVVYTSTYYDDVCSCTKTAKISSTGVSAGSTGFATGTAVGTAPGSTGTAAAGSGSSGGQATGSPIVPTVSPSATSPNAGKFTGAASKNLGSFAAAAVAVAGFAVAL